ncbi:hypothetical protein EVAR_87538_1 [Eumeta japonica]|uniref:Uncharacterized protein n=1 Tax=Eumeta variegata TaxID=151549 RepID=A0A4C1XRF3_EUMVA|nr:hypothetical protein EVAR_87538_1 [Eumeta japonica]
MLNGGYRGDQRSEDSGVSSNDVTAKAGPEPESRAGRARLVRGPRARDSSILAKLCFVARPSVKMRPFAKSRTRHASDVVWHLALGKRRGYSENFRAAEAGRSRNLQARTSYIP